MGCRPGASVLEGETPLPCPVPPPTGGKPQAPDGSAFGVLAEEKHSPLFLTPEKQHIEPRLRTLPLHGLLDEPLLSGVFAFPLSGEAEFPQSVGRKGKKSHRCHAHLALGSLVKMKTALKVI